MIVFLSSSKGFLCAVLFVSQQNPRDTFNTPLHHDLKKRPSRIYDLTIAKLVSPRPAH